MRKMVLFVALMLGICVSVNAQTSSEEWKPLKDSAAVSISYKMVNCNGQDVVFLKIDNQNNQPVALNWSLWYMSPATDVVVAAASSVSGDCSSITLKFVVPPGVTLDRAPTPFHITKLILQ